MRSACLNTSLFMRQSSGCSVGKFSRDMHVEHRSARWPRRARPCRDMPLATRPTYCGSSTGHSARRAVGDLPRAPSCRARCCSEPSASWDRAASTGLGQRRFLKACVVAHVDRALRLGHHDRIGAREAVGDALDAARLIIPLHVSRARRCPGHCAVCSQSTRGRRLPSSIGPVAPMMKTGRAVGIGVVDAHGSVQQADDIVHDHAERLRRSPWRNRARSAPRSSRAGRAASADRCRCG